MRKLLDRVSPLLAIAAFACAACNDAGPPPASPTTPAPPPPPPAPVVTTVIIDAGATTVAASDPPPAPPPATAAPLAPLAPSAGAGDAGGEFYSCNADSDCTAVFKAGCCPNGRKEAVNKQDVQAYEKAFACDKSVHRICPMYRILDKRVAVCDAPAHKCTMVSPSDIACGAGASGKTCPDGSACDSGGHCAPTH